MKRVILTTLCLATLLGVIACASRGRATVVVPTPAFAAESQELTAPVMASNTPEPAAAAPATQPAQLPADIAAMMAPAGAQAEQKPALPPIPEPGQLPSGHPDVSQMRAPPGPVMPGQPLPKGHPDISQMKRPTASTQPTLIGTVVVRAVQNTKGGPAVGAGAPVTLELYQQDQVLEKREGKLDAKGLATFERIPVGMMITPVARISYNGVDYEATGGAMDPTHADQQLQVAVYESTEQQPAWTIRMQHIMLQPTTEGVQVMEMLAVENPTDRAWIGKAGGGAHGKRVTTIFPLPPGAKDVQLVGGFHECCVKIDSDRVTNSMALVPGTSQYRIVYTLPVDDGKAQFSVTTPVGIGHVMAFVPDDGTTVTASGLESGGTADMGNGKTRFYKASDLKAGSKIQLGVSGITAATTAAGGSTPSKLAAASALSGQLAKIVAGAGGLLIFVVGGMFLLVKGPKAAKKAA